VGIFTTLSPLLNATELRDLSTRASPGVRLTDDRPTWTALLASRTLPLALPASRSNGARRVMRRSAMGDATAAAAIRATSSATSTRPKLVVCTHAQTHLVACLARSLGHAASINSCYLPKPIHVGEASASSRSGRSCTSLQRDAARGRAGILAPPSDCCLHRSCTVGQLVGQSYAAASGMIARVYADHGCGPPPCPPGGGGTAVWVPITAEYGPDRGRGNHGLHHRRDPDR
jgi:hypothetical protein